MYLDAAGQAEDRCHRIGQEDAVNATYLLAAGTIDETIATLLERKRAVIGAVTDGRPEDEQGVVDALVRELRSAPYHAQSPDGHTLCVPMEASQAQLKTALVTGGSGFLGGWCVIELLRRGYRVRTTVRNLSREAALRAAIASALDAGERLSVLAADLRSDDGWERAVDGCDYVLHVASPFPPRQPKDPDELIVPAREGTVRVLAASLDAGVQRVVVTSSIAAITGGLAPTSRALTEDDWSDPDNPRLTPYARSKTLAERTAWDLVRERGETGRLAVVNPGAILGPVLSEDRSYSIEMIERLLKGMPGVPRIGFSVVDVRDVAELHIRAMTAPEAGGERLVAVQSFQWMEQVAEVLREQLGEAAAKVPKRTVPDLLVRAMALFDPGIRSIVSQLGRRTEISSEKAKTLLGWSPRPIGETIVDCAQSLIDHGVVKQPAQ